MGWLIFAGVLIFLALLPLGVWIRYDASGPVARIVAGPIKIKVFPVKKKEKKPKPKKEKKPKAP